MIKHKILILFLIILSNNFIKNLYAMQYNKEDLKTKEIESKKIDDLPSEIIEYIIYIALKEDNLDAIFNSINNFSDVNHIFRTLINKKSSHNFILNNTFEYYLNISNKRNSNIIEEFLRVSQFYNNNPNLLKRIHNILAPKYYIFNRHKDKILINKFGKFLIENKNRINNYNRIVDQLNRELIIQTNLNKIYNVKLLLLFCKLDYQDLYNNDSALMIATKNNNKNLTLILLEHGANPNLQDLSGSTALIHAIQHNIYNNNNTDEKANIEIVKEIIKNKADLDIQDRFGNTALIYAVKQDCEHLIDILIKAGADINIKNNEDEDALTLINKDNNNTDCILI